MNVWKSPVFYFGLLLVIAVIAALAAPFVIDWNSYRAGLETYGYKVTGRKVTIGGPISVRLFPWPSLTAYDIRLANPPGLEAPELAHADRIDVRLQLAGLFSGTIQVDSIAVEHPVISFERLATGEGNWLLHPAADLASHDLLGRVSLDQITLSDASIRFIDARRGEGEVALDLPAVTLASPAIAGPWRLLANGVKHKGQSYDLSLSTATWRAGDPLRFGLRIEPSMGAEAQSQGAAGNRFGYAMSFDGALGSDGLVGGLRLEPAVDSEGKADQEGQFRPLVVTSKVAATFDSVSLDQIEIAPADPTQGGTLMSGSASFTLGREISAIFSLSAAKLDLGEWAGARANQVLREGGSLAVADSLLALLPEAMDLKGALKVTALQLGGETLENIDLQVDASHDAIRVSRLSMSLPGRSNMLFKGVFFPGKLGAELAGDLGFESNDLRQFSGWALPDIKKAADKLWTGSRGRFKLQTKVSLTQSRFRLDEAQYELDGERGSGELQISSGGRGSIALRLDTGKLDVDNLIPGGMAAAPQGGRAGLAGLLSFVVPHANARDLQLKLHAGTLLLNGVEASDVAIDVQSGANGLDLRNLAIGSVGGAKLTASGLVLDTGQGSDGSVGIDIAARDPRGLLRLLGVVPADHDPSWTSALGQTALKGTLTVKSGKDGPVAGFDAEGRSGDFDLSASGSLTGTADPSTMGISGTIDLHSPTSASLAKLAGLVPVAEDRSPAHAVLTGSGSLAQGFLTDLQVDAYGARFSYAGTTAPGGPLLELQGKAAIRSTDMAPLVAALGVPSAELLPTVLVIDSSVKSDGTVITLADIEGRFGSAPVGGKLAFGAGGKLSGNLTTGALSLSDLLGATFLAWNGTAPDLQANLAEALPLGLTGELWITPRSLVVNQTFTASEVQVGLTASPGEIRLAMFGKDAGGRDASIEVGSKGTGGNRTIDGKVTLPIDLSRQLLLVGGSPVADGTGVVDLHFDTAGRSPDGALAVLKGSGSYSIKGLRLRNISPKDFIAALGSVKDAAGLTAAFDTLRGGDGLDGGDVTGSITIDNGVAAFLPFKVSTPEADATVKAVAELAAGAIDIAVDLSIKVKAGLPAMEISYAGPPAALARNEDKSELASELGFAMMRQGVAELERLQQEQLRMAAEEEKMRKEDEAKLQAYYAQRDEILLRRRELKVHAEMRLAAAEKLRQEIESERAANAEINRLELKQRVRELRVMRRLAKLDPPVSETDVSLPPKVKPPEAKPQPKPQIQVPVILVPPASPSQQ